MMKMKKVYVVLLVAILLLACFPYAVFADDPVVTDYDIMISTSKADNSIEITDSNKDNVLSDSGTPTVVYTPKEGTSPAKLTLNNANITAKDVPAVTFVISSQSTEDLVLELIGDSVLTGSPSTTTAVCIDTNGNLTIIGDGSLTIKCAAGVPSIGIFSKGDIEFSGSGNITIEAGESIGTDTDNCVSAGIVAFSSMVINSGTITTKGNAASTQSSGVFVSDSLTVKGGSLKSIAGKVSLEDGQSLGIYSTKTTISGGVVEAFGGEAPKGLSYGIINELLLEGGIITAQGNTAALLTAPDIDNYPYPLVKVNTSPKEENSTTWEGTPQLSDESLKYVMVSPTPEVDFSVTAPGETVEITEVNFPELDEGYSIKDEYNDWYKKYIITNNGAHALNLSVSGGGSAFEAWLQNGSQALDRKATKELYVKVKEGLSGAEYSEKITITATSKADTSKTLSKDITLKLKVNSAPKPSEPSYEAKDEASGSTLGSLTWQKGSGKPLDFTIKRSVDDSLTFGLFSSLKMDENTVEKSQYTASEGSLKVSVKPEYMETLSVGEHKINVEFTDGTANLKLTVLPAAEDGGEDSGDASGGSGEDSPGDGSGSGSNSPDGSGSSANNAPKTRDENATVLWGATCIIAIAALGLLGKRRRA